MMMRCVASPHHVCFAPHLFAMSRLPSAKSSSSDVKAFMEHFIQGVMLQAACPPFYCAFVTCYVALGGYSYDNTAVVESAGWSAVNIGCFHILSEGNLCTFWLCNCMLPIRVVSDAMFWLSCKLDTHVSLPVQLAQASISTQRQP